MCDMDYMESCLIFAYYGFCFVYYLTWSLIQEELTNEVFSLRLMS